MSDKIKRTAQFGAAADTEDWWGDFEMDVPPPPLPKYKARKKQGMSAASQAMFLLTCVVAVACLCVQIFRISVITAQNKEIAALTEQIDEMESTRDNLKVRTDLQLNPERIEDEAKNRLGMYFPEGDQLRVIAIGNTNAGVVTANVAAEEGGQ